MATSNNAQKVVNSKVPRIYEWLEDIRNECISLSKYISKVDIAIKTGASYPHLSDVVELANEGFHLGPGQTLTFRHTAAVKTCAVIGLIMLQGGYNTVQNEDPYGSVIASKALLDAFPNDSNISRIELYRVAQAVYLAPERSNLVANFKTLLSLVEFIQACGIGPKSIQHKDDILTYNFSLSVDHAIGALKSLYSENRYKVTNPENGHSFIYDLDEVGLLCTEKSWESKNIHEKICAAGCFSYQYEGTIKLNFRTLAALKETAIIERLAPVFM